MKTIKTIITYCHDSNLKEGEIKIFKPFNKIGEEKVETRNETKYTTYTLSLNPNPVIISENSSVEDKKIRDLLIELRGVNNQCAGIEMWFSEEVEGPSFMLPDDKNSYNVLVKYSSELPTNCTNTLASFPVEVFEPSVPSIGDFSKFWPLKDWIVSDLNI